MAQPSVKIVCDAQPLVSFAKILECFLQISERPLDLSDFGFELARVENDMSTASTGEVFVRLYPSDALLRFAGTIFAGDFDFSVIKKAGHDSNSPNVKVTGAARLYRAASEWTAGLGGW
jgi:hypothetical protein